MVSYWRDNNGACGTCAGELPPSTDRRYASIHRKSIGLHYRKTWETSDNGRQENTQGARKSRTHSKQFADARLCEHTCLRKHRTPHPERSVRSYARQGAPSGLPSTLLLEGLVTGVTRWSRAVQAVRLLFVSRLVDASMTARPPLPRFAFLGAAKLVFIVEWIAENSEDMQKNEPAYRAKEYGHHGGRWQ